ncbi:putative ATP-dependent helicase DinG [mine drainage metagenome]|uniref:Putative ATP-dependent helicase DinG n=1 Tax=mine drainage metagenome TaxID=410659 RepID=A0A1J5QG77_9ZZZZ
MACRALGVQLRAVRLKGRSNYVCLYRLKRTQEEGRLESRRAVGELRRVALFAGTSADGDLSGLPGIDERSELMQLVTSTRDNCLGAECPDWKNCYVMKARREALAADVVIVNHHLFFANLALRDEGVADLLPSASTIVLDEAHQLPDIGAQFLGTALGSAQAAELARDVLACGLQHARGHGDWQALGAALVKAVRDLRLCAAAGAQRMDAEQAGALPGWADTLQQWDDALAALDAALQPVEPSAPEFTRLRERCAEQRALLRQWRERDDADAELPLARQTVRWVEVGHHHLRLLATPLGIGPAFSALLAQRAQAWILVSATLTLDGSFRYARARLGLNDEALALADAADDAAPARLRELRVASPFDYAACTRLLVPRSGFLPSDPDHARHVAELAARLIAVNPGGSFVLTTTLRAIGRIAERLRELLPASRPVLEQASEPKGVLLQRFGADQRAVLVGSHSFWEGVDFPGEQLTLVVIDKLPFAPPDDPLVAARVRRLEAAGRNGFLDYSLPQAALALQQGAGRLVRSELDWGVLAVCDRRLATTPWGRRLLASLQPFARIEHEREAIDFLAAHAPSVD